MDEINFCPNCRQPIQLTYVYCPNCGKKIHSDSLSTSLFSLFILILKTLLLPPFGLLWGYRYLRQSDNTSKIIGLIIIIITIIETVWLVQVTIVSINSVSQQINQIQNINYQ